MYKHSIFLLSALVALAASLPATSPPADDAACDLVDHQVRDRCIAHLPPILLEKGDIKKVLLAHPELCCITYKAVLCIKEGFEQAPACKKFMQKKMDEYEMQMKTLADSKCHLEKCKH